MIVSKILFWSVDTSCLPPTCLQTASLYLQTSTSQAPCHPLRMSHCHLHRQKPGFVAFLCASKHCTVSAVSCTSSIQPIQEQYARKFEASDLRRAFEALDVHADGIIDVHELRSALRRLGYRLSKAWMVFGVQVCITMTPRTHSPTNAQPAAEEIMWEVDEDCDGGVTWEEFQHMYHRGRGDATGVVVAVKTPNAHHHHATAQSNKKSSLRI